MSGEVFNDFRPEYRAQRIIEDARALVHLASLNLENFYEVIKIFGGSAIRVYFILYVQNGYMSASEIARIAQMPERSVYAGLKKLLEASNEEGGPADLIEKDGPMYRVTARFRRNV